MNMEIEMTEDTVKAASFEMVQFGFRGGHAEVVATSEIRAIKARQEGGTSIRLKNDHLLLTSVPLEDVMVAIRSADTGGRYAAP
jgi:hypothetical protein